MAASADRPAPGGRKRGGTRRISRAGIVEAAKRLDLQGMTMQAVADELGVDRKALNYHVASREGLLELLAADAFDGALAQTSIPEEATWQEAVVLFAQGMRDAIVATGALADYVRIGTELSVLEPAEALLERLVGAGLAGSDAAGVVQHVTLVAMGVGRDLVLQAADGVHPQMAQLISALGDEPPAGDRLPTLRRIVREAPLAFGKASFDFEMRMVLAATTSLIELGAGRTAD